MSLLLEALKKAEKAKEEAQRRARDERPAGEPEELHGAETPAEAPAEAAPPPVLTRDKLPEISQRLEILTDDLDKPAAPEPEPARAPEPVEPEPMLDERREARPSPPPPPRAETREEAGRASARKVFEAKFREPNPRMPFYITMGCLGAFAVGTVIYFYIQLRPPPALVNANPPRQAETTAAVVPPTQAPRAEALPASPAIPGLPSGAAPVVPPEPPRAPVATPEPAQQAAQPTPQAAARPQGTAPNPAPQPRLTQRATPSPLADSAPARNVPTVHPRVESGYTAYLAGNLEQARADYEMALGDDPANRDALLGVAALDVRAGRLDAAEGAYLRLLQADPRDAEAQAALMALRGARVDPVQAESRLKSMLAADPRAHSLNFALGNQLAQQGRWAEAQAQFFKAFAAEPTNPDFAYNLAVSLDHLRQSKQALEFYKHAIALARARGASFNLAAAEARAAQLSR